MMKMTNIDYKTILLFKEIAKICAPPPKLKVSEWADKYRRLSAEASAEPGRFNTDRAPYQREIMDALNDGDCEEIIIMSSAQIGKTELLLNIIGYYIDYEPSPIMVVQPNIDMAQTFSKDRLAPMIRDTEVLRTKVGEVRSRNSENTILHKKFPGGHITIVGANSTAGLASRPIRILLCDEVDRYPMSAGSEGSPIELAEKRTSTFWNRKKIKVSTPTIKGISKIESEYMNSSMEEWNVICPNCKKPQPYEWKRIDFETITMKCKYCMENIEEVDWKSSKGIYIAENDNRKIRGFHLNELASPWRKWEEIIDDFKKAKKCVKESGNNEALKVWVNTALGETWEEKGEQADDKSLMSRREYYKAELPKGVLVLTAGADVQNDRIEIEVIGWGKNYESWGIAYEKIYGDLSKEEIWEKFEEFLDREFHFENGVGLNIANTFIDTGGSYTSQVYKFLKKMERKGKRISGIKGMGGSGISLLHKMSRNNSEKVRIYILGVDTGKELVMSRLKINEVGSGYCHFPSNSEKNYKEEYFKGLVSEKRVVRIKKNGEREFVWIKKSNVRNEPLDIRNYATAAVEELRPAFNILEEKINEGINYMKVNKHTKEKRNGVINRGIIV